MRTYDNGDGESANTHSVTSWKICKKGVKRAENEQDCEIPLRVRCEVPLEKAKKLRVATGKSLLAPRRGPICGWQIGLCGMASEAVGSVPWHIRKTAFGAYAEREGAHRRHMNAVCGQDRLDAASGMGR